jgi:hypothetical protein
MVTGDKQDNILSSFVPRKKLFGNVEAGVSNFLTSESVLSGRLVIL